MKKVLASLLVLFILMVSVPLAAEACPAHHRRNLYRRTYASRYYSAPRYRTAGYTYRKRSFYEKHRDKVNLAIGTGAGALIGGIAKGRKGAGIGALVGLGGGALYTYVLNKKKRRY